MTASIVAQQIDAGAQVAALAVNGAPRCPYCRQDLPADADRCRACGAPSPTVSIDLQIENYLSRFDAMTAEQKKGQLDLALTMLPDVRTTIDADRLVALRADLEELVRDGDQVAPMIFDNLAWLAAMEDVGFVVDLATGMPAGFDVTRPPALPLL